jgi:hypothetical protein
MSEYLRTLGGPKDIAEGLNAEAAKTSAKAVGADKALKLNKQAEYVRTLGGPKAVAEDLQGQATQTASDYALRTVNAAKISQAQRALKANADQLSAAYENLASQMGDHTLTAEARKGVQAQLENVQSEITKNAETLAKFQSEAGKQIDFSQLRGIKRLAETRAKNIGAFDGNANLDGQFYRNLLVKLGEYEDNIVNSKVDPMLAKRFNGLKTDFQDITTLEDASKITSVVNQEQGATGFQSIPANTRDVVHTLVPRILTPDRVDKYGQAMRSFGTIRPEATGNPITDGLANVSQQGIIPSVANLAAKGDLGRGALNVSGLLNFSNPRGNSDEQSSQFLETITANAISKSMKEFEGLPPEEQESLYAAKRNQIQETVAPLLQAVSIGDRQASEEALAQIMKTPQAKELGLAIIPKSGMAGEIEVDGKRKLPIYEDAVKYANKKAKDRTVGFGERFDAYDLMVRERVVK